MNFIILSKTFGAKEVLIDDEDYKKISPYTWSVNLDNGNFYAGAWVDGKRIRMHRFIMGATDPEKLIDHRNGNTLDNQKDNLRDSTKSQNNCNRISKRNASSKYLGVSFDKARNKWQSHIKDTKTKKHHYLGRFDSEKDAAIAYNSRAIEIHGEFAKINVL